jgi:hypothetical protein
MYPNGSSADLELREDYCYPGASSGVVITNSRLSRS